MSAEVTKTRSLLYGAYGYTGRLPAELAAAKNIDVILAGRNRVWEEAIDGDGRSFKASLSTPDAYDFAANSALEIASRITSLPVPLGLVTPFQAFGADFVLTLPGCTRTDISSS